MNQGIIDRYSSVLKAVINAQMEIRVAKLYAGDYYAKHFDEMLNNLEGLYRDVEEEVMAAWEIDLERGKLE